MMILRARKREVLQRPQGGSAARKRFSLKRLRQAASETEGSQLLEFAMTLPLLLVFVMGVVQFAGAFNLKQKMANAAREGARIMVSSVLAGSGCTSSAQNCSAQAAAQAVANYMTEAGVDSSCISPTGLTSTGTETWSYTCKSGISLTINHLYVYTPTGGSPVTGTQVTLTYPYTWFLNDILQPLVPGANISLPKDLTETAVMQNISNN